MACAADALQERGDPARRAHLADEVDVADVDAELERGGRDQRLEAAFLEPRLGVEAMLLRQAAVVRRDVLRADAIGEVARRAFGKAPVVHEDERGPVRLDQFREPLVQLVPDLVRHHRLERRARQLEREVPLAHVAGVHDLDGVRAIADQEPRHRVERLDRRREADAHRRLPQSASSRSSESIRCEPRLLPATECSSSTMTLRTLFSIVRPDSEVSRMKSDSGVVTRMCGGVLRIRLRSNAEVSPVRTASRIGTSSTPMLQELVADAGERLLEVLLDVVRERLQRRDVEDVDLVREALARGPPRPGR